MPKVTQRIARIGHAGDIINRLNEMHDKGALKDLMVVYTTDEEEEDAFQVINCQWSKDMSFLRGLGMASILKQDFFNLRPETD